MDWMPFLIRDLYVQYTCVCTVCKKNRYLYLYYIRRIYVDIDIYIYVYICIKSSDEVKGRVVLFGG